MYRLLWVQVAIAYMIDLKLGEPKRISHPVVLIGRLIELLDRTFNKQIRPALIKRTLGFITVVVVISVTFAITWAIIEAISYYSHGLSFFVSIILISMTIATRGLMISARNIASSLKDNNLEEARIRVAEIVGRDTGNMKRRDIVRATIESVAENSVDAVIAPMFYAFIGGAPLAMAYKAVNTLDSMIAYKNERYGDFGWAAAHFDDLVNYIPARIAVLLIAFGAFIMRRNPGKAIAIAYRDARKHASLNSGYPEAAFAGAVGLKLGGTNHYQGTPRISAHIGDGKGAITDKHIGEAITLLFITSALTLILARGIYFIISLFNA